MRKAIFLLTFSLGWAFFESMVSAQNKTAVCLFTIERIGRNEPSFADFKITVTNQTATAIEIQHLAGPPFILYYVVGNHKYLAMHKEDWYDSMRGASRESHRRVVPGHLWTSFRVDLQGDYVVVKSGRAILFRDLAPGKRGLIELTPTDERLIPFDANQQSLPCKGASIAWGDRRGKAL